MPARPFGLPARRPPPSALLLLATLSLACARPSLRSAPPPTAIRVVTYNIFAGNDLARTSNLTRVGALLDSLRADVVFLQEVDKGTRRSGPVDQPAVLARESKLAVVFGRSMEYGGGEFGNAVLTRFPITRWTVLPLEPPPGADTVAGYEPRTLLHLVVTTPAGPVHLLNTHLDHRPPPSVRQAQILRILAYVADSIPRGAPVILGGDLNASATAPELRALASTFAHAWDDCGEGPGFTFRSDNPDRRIDHVLLRGASCSRAVVLRQTLSDHLPVIVDVLLNR